jgi:uncharacterized protein YlxP (DUF503 family)
MVWTMMHVWALAVEFHIPESGSLKAKRAVVKHVVETSKSRFGVAAAEVGHQDRWQHSEVAFAAVGGSPGHVQDVLDSVERFVWTQPNLTVIAAQRTWSETE